jgi:pyrroline-5-carboxylate reductase
MRMSIIGCGNMGYAIAQRLSETHQLYFYDRHPEKTAELEQKGYGIACHTIKDAIEQAELVILAIKPHNVKEASQSIAERLKEKQILVSLLSGTTINALKDLFPEVRVVRMMPNLPIIYGEGVIGLSAEEDLPANIKEMLTQAFEPLGMLYWLPEAKINALTALTGSGPAFFYTMVEAMVDAGIAMGFTAPHAQDLLCQMMQGSIALLEKSSKHPGELKWQITSPQGTTIAGLKTLEENAVRAGIMNTFLSAYEHANKLSS